MKRQNIPELPDPKEDQCFVYICTDGNNTRRQVCGSVSRGEWVQLLGELEIAKKTIMEGLEE